MGATKSELFTASQNELAAVARALAHPARIAIVQHLLRVNACITGDMVEQLPLAQATISQHLRELKDAGIIQGTIEGAKVNYCINGARWREIQALLNGLFDTYVQDQTCC
ncbi:MAG: winged helix-turn-helix transcriptional regulator [Saprospiraceae bacterium]|nr:winged helix-turn-helix transcriptional regulator [Saprospiraceae bacterium]